MDVLTRMYDHHVELTGAIIDRLTGLPAEVLDQPIELPVESIDARPNLRALCERLVRQLEMWVSAVEGATSIHAGQASPAADPMHFVGGEGSDASGITRHFE